MLITNFASGELSEKIYGRVDLGQYYQGASYINNFNINILGGVKRRTGFKRLAKLNGNSKLVPFIVDSNLSFILEFTEKKVYVWENGKKLIDYNDNQLCYETEYLQAEINDIQYAQNYNTMIFVHENHTPYSLVYDFATKNFSFEKMQFNFIPDVNIDDDYNLIIYADLALPAVIKVNDNEYIIDNKTYRKNEMFCVFEAQLYYYDSEKEEWTHFANNDPNIDKGIFTTEGNYPSSVAFFNSRLWFASTKKSAQGIWASATVDTEGTRYRNFATYQKYITVNKVLKDSDTHIFTGDILLENVTDDYTLITNVTQDFTKENVLEKDFKDYYISSEFFPVGSKIVELTADTMKINAKANITEDKKAVVSTIQLWKDINITTNEDYEYYIVSNNSVTADCSFNFEIASNENDKIRWLATNKFLCIGTESSIWNIPNGVNAIQIYSEMAGRYGTDKIQALCIDTAIVYFAQGKYAIREYYYNNQTEAFTTNNIAILAEQMLNESYVVDFDYLTNPYNKLFIVRADGKAVELLYDKNNGILAWSRCTHGNALIKSCCVTRGDKQNDLIYVSVFDNGEYYLELLDDNNKVYLDSYDLFTPSKVMNYQNNAIVYNETKDLISNINEIPDDFINAGDVVYIGYNYFSELHSLPIVDNSEKKRIVNLQIRFLNSFMPFLTFDEAPDERFNNVKEPYSGIQKITIPGKSEKDVFFKIKYNGVKAVNILSINAITT